MDRLKRPELFFGDWRKRLKTPVTRYHVETSSQKKLFEKLKFIHYCPVNFEKIPCPANRSGGLASLRNNGLLMMFAVERGVS